MSRPEIKLEARLKAVSGITALTSTRIWPDYRMNETLPAITYEVVSDTPIRAAEAADSGSSVMRITVFAYTSTRLGAKTLGDLIRTNMSGWADADGCWWQLDSRSDDLGEVNPGTNQVSCYIDVQNYLVCYS